MNQRKSLQAHEFVKSLQCILYVSWTELLNARDKLIIEDKTPQHPIDSALTASAKVFLDRMGLPITYTNVNPTPCYLVHWSIGPCEFHQICGNAIKVDLPNDMMIYNTGKVARLKVDHMHNSRVTWLLPPPHVWTSRMGTRYIVIAVANRWPSAGRTDWASEVKWECWDEKVTIRALEVNMSKAMEMV